MKFFSKKKMIFLLSFLMIICLYSEENIEQNKINVVLWTGGKFHKFDEITKIMEEFLPKYLPMKLTVVKDCKFVDTMKMENIDVIIMNHCFKSNKNIMSDEQGKKLLDMVNHGVGIVAIHSSYWSFGNGKRDIHKLYGTHFIKHGAKIKVNVKTTNKNHPITQGLEPSFEIEKEELYMSVPLAKDCNLLMEACYKKNSEETEYFPSVWTLLYGKGKIVTILPGHFPKAYQIEPFQKLILSSTKWVCE